jgi:hypothetical protein
MPQMSFNAVEKSNTIPTSQTETSLAGVDHRRPFFNGLLANFSLNLVIASFAFILVHKLVSHAHLLSSTPIYSDDYDFLASSINHLKWNYFRPLSTFVWSISASFGAQILFAFTEVVTLVYVALTFTYVKLLFPTEKNSLLPDTILTLAGALIAVSYESLTQHYYFSGTQQNMLAGCFALCSMLSYLSNQNKARPALTTALPTIFFTASVLSKEDFILPTGLFFLFFAVFGAKGNRKWAATTLVMAVLATISVTVLQKFVIGSQFFSGASSHYVIDLHAQSILSMYWKYITCSAGTTIAACLQLLITLAVCIIGKIEDKKRALLIFAQTILMIAPFSLLPNHFIEYFAFNWICLQAACVFALMKSLPSHNKALRLSLVTVFLILGTFTVAATQAGRHDLQTWFEKKAEINENVDDFLAEKKQIVVINPPECGPWTATNGAYLKRKLGFPSQWILLTPKNSQFDNFAHSFTASKVGSIEVRTFDGDAAPKLGITTITFDNDGHGAITSGE